MIREANKKVLIGKVVSNKMDKSVTVLVERLKLHPMYKKYLRKSKKFKAHDENNICKVGDKVKIVECRPISRHKHFMLAEVLEKTRGY